MRILICRSCEDAIQLKSVAKWCECGKSGGAMVGLDLPICWGEHAFVFKLNKFSLGNLRNPPTGSWKRNEVEALLIPSTTEAPKRVQCPLSVLPKTSI